jgi:hypothetical protein
MNGSGYQVKYNELRRMVDRFERDSGVNIAVPWREGNVGEAVRIVMACGPGRTVRRMRAVADRTVELGRSMHRQLDEMEVDAIVSSQEDMFDG